MALTTPGGEDFDGDSLGISASDFHFPSSPLKAKLGDIKKVLSLFLK